MLWHENDESERGGRVLLVDHGRSGLLFWNGVASSSSENAQVQIRSSQDPSHGLLEGSHEAFNTGIQHKNGVLCIPVHHFWTLLMGAIGL